MSLDETINKFRDKHGITKHFVVMNNATGREFDKIDIAKFTQIEIDLQTLMWDDILGFAMLPDGRLVLLDELGQYSFVPMDKVTVKILLK